MHRSRTPILSRSARESDSSTAWSPQLEQVGLMRRWRTKYLDMVSSPTSYNKMLSILYNNNDIILHYYKNNWKTYNEIDQFGALDTSKIAPVTGAIPPVCDNQRNSRRTVNLTLFGRPLGLYNVPWKTLYCYVYEDHTRIHELISYLVKELFRREICITFFWTGWIDKKVGNMGNMAFIYLAVKHLKASLHHLKYIYCTPLAAPSSWANNVDLHFSFSVMVNLWARCCMGALGHQLAPAFLISCCSCSVSVSQVFLPATFWSSSDSGLAFAYHSRPPKAPHCDCQSINNQLNFK